MSYLKALISNKQYHVEPDSCFVLMSFRPDYLDVFRTVKHALAELTPPIKAHRADEFSASTPIIDDIISQLMSADFIVADLTTQNPNVLYELGLSHALKDDVILLTQTPEAVPFDVTHLRLLTYKHTPEGLQDLATRLREIISTLRINRQIDSRISFLKQLSLACAVRIQDWLRLFINVMTAIAGWPELQTNEPESHCQVLSKIRSVLSTFTGGIYTLDESGIIVASTPVNIVGQRYAHREYFRQCSTSFRPVVSNSFDSANRERRIIVIAVPRYNSAGSFIGILDAVLDVCDAIFMDIINDLLAGLNEAGRPEISILDAGNVVIASSNHKLLGNNLGGEALLKKLREEMGVARDEAAGRVGREMGAVFRIKATPFIVLTVANI